MACCFDSGGAGVEAEETHGEYVGLGDGADVSLWQVLSLRVWCIGVTSFAGDFALLDEYDGLLPQHYLGVFVVLSLLPSTQRHLLQNADEVFLSLVRMDSFRSYANTVGAIGSDECASRSRGRALQLMGHLYLQTSAIKRRFLFPFLTYRDYYVS